MMRGAKLGQGALWSAALLASTMLAGVPEAAAQDEPTTVDEVLVTAQKREESLQDVPISIQALPTEKLDELGVSDFTDYVKFLPSVSFQTLQPGFTNVYMRGVASGDNINHSASLPSVGIYLDEQPITTIQGALDINIYDVARVESLAGPQGTLYGASSQAGTIRIITNKPDPSGFAAGVDAELNTVSGGGVGGELEGFVNLPLSDRAAARLVGWYREDAGYIDNVLQTRTYPTPGVPIDNARLVEEDYNEARTWGGRAALRFDLNDDWTITPTIMGQRQETGGFFAYDPTIGDLKVAHFFPESSEDSWYQAALTIEGKLGNFDVLYAGAYLRRDVDYEQDYSDYSYFYDVLFGYGAYWVDDAGNPLADPGQYIHGFDGYKRQTHELRFNWTGERMRLVGGLYYQNSEHYILQEYLVDDLDGSLEVTGRPDTLWLTAQIREDMDAAAFGELSYDFTDRVTGNFGIRFFKAENSLRGFFGFGTGYSGSTGEAACFGPPIVAPGPCTNLNKEVEESGFTHRANLTYKFDEDRMVYVTWSTGFRPGGINRRGTLPPYSSDFLTNYEFGWKTTWLDGRLRWNGAVYALRWEDFQFSILGSQGLTEIRNAAQAEVVGLESDVVWRPTMGLTISGGVSLTNAELSEDYCGFVNASGEPETNCPAPLAPAGTELPVTPSVKANLVARYEFPVASFDGHVQGAVVYTGENWTDLRLLERSIIGRQDAFTTVDLTAGISNETWKVEGFIDNAFDERGSLWRFAQCNESVCGFRTYVAPNRPRTIGVRLGRKF